MKSKKDDSGTIPKSSFSPNKLSIFLPVSTKRDTVQFRAILCMRRGWDILELL
jgi:hypothetical protein